MRGPQVAARSRGWKLLSLEIKNAGEIEAAFKTATDARAGALLVLTGHHAYANRQRIAELATRHRLRSMFDLRPYVDAGGLVSYGANLVDIWRQSARFVDQILKGDKLANLPVEQPTRFELIINLKAANAIGLAIPPAIRLRADESIESVWAVLPGGMRRLEAAEIGVPKELYSSFSSWILRVMVLRPMPSF